MNIHYKINPQYIYDCVSNSDEPFSVFAKRCDITYMTLLRVLKGKRVKHCTVRKIAAALGKPESEIAERVEK